jgi:hypothetical protein
MEMSGASVLRDYLNDFFPAGIPYLRFHEDNTVDMFHFSFEYDVDSDTLTGNIEFGTYKMDGSSISITDSAGRIIALSLDGDFIVWQTDTTIMRFRYQGI